MRILKLIFISFVLLECDSDANLNKEITNNFSEAELLYNYHFSFYDNAKEFRDSYLDNKTAN